jgi:hypothetical protein
MAQLAIHNLSLKLLRRRAHANKSLPKWKHWQAFALQLNNQLRRVKSVKAYILYVVIFRKLHNMPFNKSVISYVPISYHDVPIPHPLLI